jgi:hypothetical protein
MSDEYENLVAECKEEIIVFERPQARNSIALIDAVEQLQKENADLRKELVAAVELMEGFNKDVAEFSNTEE